LVRFQADRRHQFILNARSLYYDYARLSLEYPEYFCDYWARADISSIERAKYIRFVSYMINGIEDIICSDPDSQWRNALKSDFRYHVDFLNSEEFAKLSEYFFADTHKMIAEVLAEQDKVVQ
jgi:hypothetical protein